MKEFLKEEIRRIADKVSFLRSVLLALISGIVGILFGITQDKIILNYSLIVLLAIGIVLGILISLRISVLEDERSKFISKLKDLE